MNKKELEKLSGEVVAFIKKGQREFVTWIKDNEKAITQAIINDIQKNTPMTKTGAINQQQMGAFTAGLPARVRKVMRELGYESYVTNYVADFQKITKLNARLHGRANGISSKELNRLASRVQSTSTQIVLDNLLGDGLDSSYVRPIKSLLLQAGTTGMSLQKFVEELNNVAVGTGDLTKFGNFALQNGRDALGQYDGTLNEKIARNFDLNAIVYVGSIVEDTRAQCERWLGKEFILIEDLQSEIDWAFDNGKGMNEATTPDNFMIYRGGYSCRHKAVPIRVTEEQIKSQTLE